MSYDGYNYSPYFQQASDSGRSQQTLSPQSQANGPYYRQPQQAVDSHSYASQQMQYRVPAPPRRDLDVHMEQNHNNFNAARLHSAREQHHFGPPHSEVHSYNTNTPAYTDTSTLGRLAYASGLRPEQHPFGPPRSEVHSYNATTAAYADIPTLGSLAYASGLEAEQTGRSAPVRRDSPLTGSTTNPGRSQSAITTTRTSTVGQPTTFSISNEQHHSSCSEAVHGEPNAPTAKPAIHRRPSSSTTSQQTLWPQSKKVALATAAKVALTSAPVNVGKKISSQEILQLLDQNLSYNKLCENLEARGFILDRWHFARLLLAAVSDVSPGALSRTPIKGSPQNAYQIECSSEPTRQPSSALAVGSSHSGIRTLGAPPSAESLKPHSNSFDPPHQSVLPFREERLQASMDRLPPNSHITLHQPSLVNGSPTYSGPGISFNNPNVASPARNFRPVSAVQSKRAGPSPHALHEQHHGEIIPKLQIKEKMARNTNFSEIVDLTQLSEDEHEQNLVKRPELSTQTEMQRDLSDNVHLHNPTLNKISVPYSAEQQMTRDKAGHERILGNIPAPRTKHTKHLTTTTNGGTDLSQFRYAKNSSLQRELSKAENIVQPMDKKNALRRSTYNAKTIARDVLVAAGHHLKDKPLNWHLHPLLQNFRHVNYGSDLSTFNWDLVDPFEKTDSMNILTEGTDADNGGDVTQVEHSSSVQTLMLRHSTRVDLTTGDDNGVVSVDVEPPRLDKGVKSRPQGWRQRLDDPAVHSRPSDSFAGSLNLRKPRGSISTEKSEDIRRRLPSGAVSTFPDTSISRMPAGSTQTSSCDHTNALQVEINHLPSLTQRSSANRSLNESLIKRRGQLPESIRVSSSVSADEVSRGRQPDNKNVSSSKSSTPSSNRHFSILTRTHGTDTTPARPSGLRNTMIPSDGIAVVIATPSRGTNIKRKRKGSSQGSDESLKAAPHKRQESSPAYRVYKCEWRGCKAELHNLKTLRKHVHKLHRIKPNNADGIPCLWLNCENTRHVYDKQTRLKKEVYYPHTFSNSNLWDTHVDRKHLEPIAWALGDGPSAHPSDLEASDYPSDSAGRLITPIARSASPRDPLHLPS